MRAAGLPVPGVVLGPYPERRAGESRPQARQGRPWRERDFVPRVRALETSYCELTPQQFGALTSRARERLAREGFARQGFASEALVEAFALVAAAGRRELGIEFYDAQIAAARIMVDWGLVEMATGEGKTIAGAAAAATAALAGIPVHLVTTNDYLAGRDASNLTPFYRALGLTVGAVIRESDTAARRAAYACDVTYCSAKELAFDYLRDRVSRQRGDDLEQRAARLAAGRAPDTLLRGLCMAIIDEADSVLIDEARMPLILSQACPAVADATLTRHAWRLAAELAPGHHYIVDAELRKAVLTDAGRLRLRALANADGGGYLSSRHCQDAVVAALAARHLFMRDRDYLVRDGKVLIIDEMTGRAAPGRAWSQGIHQMVEIKEGCPPSAPPVPVAQTTFQRFFCRYFRLGGMSGTLLEARQELRKVYGLEVARVGLRLPSRRETWEARVFADRDAQWRAVVERVSQFNRRGRPVLIGTGSVGDSEALSVRLAAAGLRHVVLNARQDQAEAEIVARGGARHAITVSTNMAGRGTDIAVDAAARALGGLHVISCQQNIARRIDRQLIGRCARRGEPGSAEAFIALDGPLLAHSRLARLLRRFVRGEMRRLAWTGVALLRLSQLGIERRQRHERRALMRRDEEMGRSLSFSGSLD